MQGLSIKPIPTHQAQNFRDCVDMQDQATSQMCPPSNQSAVKVKALKVLNPQHLAQCKSNFDEQRGGMSLLDQPLNDGDKFESLTKSVVNQTKCQSKRKFGLNERIPDFKFDDFL